MLELLSLTSDNDLVLVKIDDYYLCLAEPSKRNYNLNWYQAIDYCKLLGKDYYLPNKDELNLIYTNKGDISLVEVCLYNNEVYTLDFVSKKYSEEHLYYARLRSSSEFGSIFAYAQDFINGNQGHYIKSWINCWVLPVRRIKC